MLLLAVALMLISGLAMEDCGLKYDKGSRYKQPVGVQKLYQTNSTSGKILILLYKKTSVS
jgi:hypothetical protein